MNEMLIELKYEVEGSPEIQAFLGTVEFGKMYAVVQPETGIQIGTAKRIAETGVFEYSWISEEQYNALLAMRDAGGAASSSQGGELEDGEKIKQGKAPKGWHWPPGRESIELHDAMAIVDLVDFRKELEGEMGLDEDPERPLYQRIDEMIAEQIVDRMNEAWSYPVALIIHPDDAESLVSEVVVEGVPWIARNVSPAEIYYRNIRVWRSLDATPGSPALI